MSRSLEDILRAARLDGASLDAPPPCPPGVDPALWEHAQRMPNSPILVLMLMDRLRSMAKLNVLLAFVLMISCIAQLMIAILR